MMLKDLTKQEKALCKRIDATDLEALEEFLTALDPASPKNFSLLCKLVRYCRAGELEALAFMQNARDHVQYIDRQTWRMLFGKEKRHELPTYKSII